jgi:hypothetical protein
MERIRQQFYWDNCNKCEYHTFNDADPRLKYQWCRKWEWECINISSDNMVECLSEKNSTLVSQAKTMKNQIKLADTRIAELLKHR